jgi:hypothetical protein
LEDRDHVIQYPFTEHVVIEKSEEDSLGLWRGNGKRQKIAGTSG